MNTETREAIERLRKHLAACDNDRFQHESPYAWNRGEYEHAKDATHVVRLCLAEHHADDAEEITAGWLSECGFCRCGDYAAMTFDFGVDMAGATPVQLTALTPSRDEGWCVILGNEGDESAALLTMQHYHTKGDLRQLMRGLGQEICPTIFN